MTSAFTRRATLKAVAASVVTFTLPAFAAYPDKLVKIIVTFPPGGASDVVARIFAEQLPKQLGGNAVVVDNKPGAGGTIGGSFVTQSAPDGYTFMLSNTTPIGLGPFTLEKLPYDPVQDFSHVAYLGSAPLVVMANPNAGLKTFADLETRAKKEGRLDFGSGGPGSIGHIHGELIKKHQNLNMVHVPYRGGAPMTTDLLAGVIPVGIDVITAYLPFFKTGQIIPLAVTSTTRTPLLPDVPTMVELGKRNLVLENFFGLSGPAKLPAEVIAKMHEACNEILKMPDIKRRMLDLGITTLPLTVAAFNTFVKDQVAVLGPAVKGAGIKL